MSALKSIQKIDYTVIFARNLDQMRIFYGDALGFEFLRSFGDAWFEYKVGPNTLALTQRGSLFDDPPTPHGALAMQIAFKVAPDEVARCVSELAEAGVEPVLPITDQPWGHRTVFFRDPDGNIIEIYAEILADPRL